MKQRLTLIAIAAVGLLATACLDFFSPTATTNGPGDATATVTRAQPAPSASPTPKTTPTPLATPDPCRAKAIVAAFSGGTQPNEILVTEAPKILDATAKNDQGDIADGCNQTRYPAWKSLTPTVCAILGEGWNPPLDGLRVGSCEIRTCLRQAGDGPCFPELGDVLLPGETNPVTSPVFQVSVK